jgi:hypothetical protein
MLLSSIVGGMAGADDIVWFEFIESMIFSKQVRELGVDVLARIQSDLVQNPERGIGERNAWRSKG